MNRDMSRYKNTYLVDNSEAKMYLTSESTAKMYAKVGLDVYKIERQKNGKLKLVPYGA